MNDLEKDELISLIELRDATIKNHKNTTDRLNHNIEMRDEVINTRNNQIVELNNTIRDLTEKIIRKDNLIKKYKKTITDNENNLSLKNDRIQELEMTIKDVKAQRDALRNMDNDSIIAHKDGVIRDLKIMNEGLAEKLRSKDFQINFLKSKVDWLHSRLTLKETKEVPEVKHDIRYIMTANEALKLYERLDLIESLVNKHENYIFGGKNND